MLIVAFGLSAGIAVAVAPQAFITAVPVLASPLSVGAVVAFLMNLFTLPTVSKRSSRAVPLDSGAVGAVSDWFGGVARSWALKPNTATTVDQSLGELTDLLLDRGVPYLDLGARLAEDRVELTLKWAGEPLPEPPDKAGAQDVMGSDEARHRFSVWLATRQAQDFRLRQVGGDNEFWLAFED
jgi:xanthine permease XanP